MIVKTFRLFWMTIALCALFIMPAMAQEEQLHESSKGGYAIQPPTGWEVVSGELDEKEFKKLPKEIQENYDANTTDAMFMDLTGGGKGKQGFKDNINIVVLEDPVPIKEALAEELQKILGDQYKGLFQNFELEGFATRSFGDNESIHITATYELLNYKLYLYQALMTGPKTGIVITCTMEESRKDERVPDCESAFNSIKFKGAEGETPPEPSK